MTEPRPSASVMQPMHCGFCGVVTYADVAGSGLYCAGHCREPAQPTRRASRPPVAYLLTHLIAEGFVSRPHRDRFRIDLSDTVYDTAGHNAVTTGVDGMTTSVVATNCSDCVVDDPVVDVAVLSDVDDDDDDEAGASQQAEQVSGEATGGAFRV